MLIFMKKKTLETTEAGILTKRSHDKRFSHFPNCFFDSDISFKINVLTQDYLLCLLIFYFMTAS